MTINFKTKKKRISRTITQVPYNHHWNTETSQYTFNVYKVTVIKLEEIESKVNHPSYPNKSTNGAVTFVLRAFGAFLLSSK